MGYLRKKNGFFVLSWVIIILLWGITPAIYAKASCADGNHDWEVVEHIPPTETSEGSIKYCCRICGDEYKEILFPETLVWGEWVIEKEPTCSEVGRKIRSTISGGAHTQTEVIPQLQHKYKLSETIQPTCTEAGKRIYKCSVCGNIRTETFGEPQGHRYKETVIKTPTCTEDGVIKFTCEHCGDSYENPVPALGHLYGDWIIRIPATENAEGQQYKECSICGDRVWAKIPSLAKEDKPFQFGITEMTVTGGNLLLWIIIFFALLGDFKLFLWIRRKKKEIDDNHKYLEEGLDGYEYI